MTDHLLDTFCGRARGRNWVRTFAVIAMLALCAVVRPVWAGSENLPGQYELRRMLKFYVVNTSNVDFTASIRWINSHSLTAPACFTSCTEAFFTPWPAPGRRPWQYR